jgi:threonine dehydratase
MSVVLSEQPGAFLSMYSELYPPRNVTGFTYRADGTEKANVLMTFQAALGSTVDEDRVIVKDILTGMGLAVADLQSNEMAKTHAKYLTGGRVRCSSLPSSQHPPATALTPNI